MVTSYEVVKRGEKSPPQTEQLKARRGLAVPPPRPMKDTFAPGSQPRSVFILEKAPS